MVKLHSRLADTWDAEPFVARLTQRTDLPVPVRKTEALLADSDTPAADAEGFRIVVYPSATKSNGGLQLPSELSYLAEGDIVRIVPRSGELLVLYRKASRSNAVLLTEQCSSNCLMCSQPPKTADDSYLVELWAETIPLMSRETPELTITGGEPTLRGRGFLQIVRACKNHLPQTALHVLSNGRLFKYLKYCEDLARVEHPDLMIGIPIYSDLAHVHDFVVQAPGAFDETIRGIMNLKRCGLRVELRVVIHRQTIGRLVALAGFIRRNLLFVDHVALMGLELMGYVRMNFEALWIDPFDYQLELAAAVEELASGGMNVSIYNHQLCLLPRTLWPIARKSISDWKNEYLEECSDCVVRSQCGGLFSSSRVRYSGHIAAIRQLT